MSKILACIDGSSYANAVCDHALWFAGRLQADVDLLHVREHRLRLWDSPAAAAVQRLRDGGLPSARVVERQGRFAEVAVDLALSADLIVLGKRGEDNDSRRRLLGSNVDAVVRRTTKPLCLVSHLFLPISRALVLLDADPDHRAAVEFLAGSPALRGLDLDLVVMALPNAPKTGGGLSLQYTDNVRDGLEGYGRVDFYKGSLYADETNITKTRPQKPVNVRVGLRTRTTRVEAFVTNAFNDRAPKGVSRLSDGLRGGQPYFGLGLPELRRVGVRASYGF